MKEMDIIDSERFHQHRNVGRKRMKAAIVITASVMIAEFIGGILANSLALISDAGHMLAHFFALGMSFVALSIAQKPATKEKTYGFYRAEILAAFLNGIFLVFVAAYIFYRGIMRLISPEEILVKHMLIVATVGLVANGINIFLLKESSREDINIKGAFIHVLGDTISSVAVVGGGIVIYFTEKSIIDPMLSILICSLIVIWAWRLLKESANILLEATPKHIDVDEIGRYLKANVPQIEEIHDIHVWTISTAMYAMTAHVLIKDCLLSKSQLILDEIRRLVEKKFQIKHTNIQLETYPTQSK